LGLRSEKTLHTSELERDDVKAKRQEWHVFQNTADASKLVFLDESGINAVALSSNMIGTAYVKLNCYNDMLVHQAKS
jgi:hypothetical protein